MAVYFIFHNRIRDAEKMQEYVQKAHEVIAPYNPEVLVWEENSEVMDGSTNLPRTIVVKFDSRDTAMAWYNSPEYQALRPLRLEATEGYTVLVNGGTPPEN